MKLPPSSLVHQHKLMRRLTMSRPKTKTSVIAHVTSLQAAAMLSAAVTRTAPPKQSSRGALVASALTRASMEPHCPMKNASNAIESHGLTTFEVVFTFMRKYTANSSALELRQSAQLPPTS